MIVQHAHNVVLPDWVSFACFQFMVLAWGHFWICLARYFREARKSDRPLDR